SPPRRTRARPHPADQPQATPGARDHDHLHHAVHRCGPDGGGGAPLLRRAVPPAGRLRGPPHRPLADVVAARRPGHGPCRAGLIPAPRWRHRGSPEPCDRTPGPRAALGAKRVECRPASRQRLSVASRSPSPISTTPVTRSRFRRTPDRLSQPTPRSTIHPTTPSQTAVSIANQAPSRIENSRTGTPVGMKPGRKATKNAPIFGLQRLEIRPLT